jgi:glycosyltransferase involved in cell wall biosynthesis
MTGRSPRVVIGVPVYGKAEYLEQAVRSLLGQTFADLRVVLIDDRSPDASEEIARAIAASDPRLEVHGNERRLGMLANTNRALSLARERHPGAEFWALGSDHDLWEPRWLERLVAALEADPRAVLATPFADRIDEHGRPYAATKPHREITTAGIDDPVRRLEVAFRDMAAGNMIYGLFRASALDAVGLYRPVLVPDRLFLSELALRGTFVAVPELLWHRRFRGLADLDRQRRAFFPEGVPAYARAPWWLQHAGALALAYGAGAAGRDAGVAGRDGLALAVRYARLALALRARRRRGRIRRYHPRRLAKRMLGRLLARVGPAAGRSGRAALDALGSRPLTRRLVTRLRPRFERAAQALAGEGRT